MLSPAVRHALMAATGALGALLAAAAVSQPELDRTGTDAERQTVEKIREIESLGGPGSADLIAPYTTLALLYQESRDHDLASATIQRAIGLVRAHYGLYSLEQAPLLRQWIESEEAVGDVASAWDLERQLLALAQRDRGDLRSADIFRELAGKRMELLGDYVEGGFPPQIYLGCYYDFHAKRRGDPANCFSGSKGRVISSLQSEVQSYLAQSINIILRNGRYASDELRDTLTTLIHNSYRYGHQALGRRSLRYMLAYGTSTDEERVARIDMLVQLADWDLLHASGLNDNEEALATYERAYGLLRETGSNEAIEEAFGPAVPVVLPSFAPNPLASEGSGASRRYIDVAFDITRYGRSDEIEILATTRNASRSDEKELVRRIKQSRFRPRATDGRIADTSRVVLRYYPN